MEEYRDRVAADAQYLKFKKRQPGVAKAIAQARGEAV